MLTQNGQVLGESVRYNGGVAQLGQTAWLYDGTTHVVVGLVDDDHTSSSTGHQSSTATLMNAAGQVIGISSLYIDGVSSVGGSAWLYEGGTTINIGLVGGEHTQSNGFKYSEVGDLNESGHVIGRSVRYYGGNNSLGNTAWLYDGVTTQELGLTGPEYEGSTGVKSSFATFLNETGQVAGISLREPPSFGFGLGQDAWLYDPALDQTFSLQLSVRSDGVASSTVDYLGDDGVVLGRYTLFDALDNSLGERAFYFTIADGLHDLGALVDGGLSANGWEFLANHLSVNGLGQIVGSGKLTAQSGGEMLYLLTRVPEPGAGVLACLACVVALSRARRWSC